MTFQDSGSCKSKSVYRVQVKAGAVWSPVTDGVYSTSKAAGERMDALDLANPYSCYRVIQVVSIVQVMKESTPTKVQDHILEIRDAIQLNRKVNDTVTTPIYL